MVAVVDRSYLKFPLGERSGVADLEVVLGRLILERRVFRAST